ncbi:MAG TPA: lipid II flippase MurJ [Jatrophihabitantaceae bacterium]
MTSTAGTHRRRLVRAAALIASITVLARLVGFARTTTFGHTVGGGCVGAVYQTTNTVPNIVFDIVAGGMLSALVVPLLAPAFADGDRERISQTVSALLNWALVILLPIAVVLAVAARPIVELLLGTGQCDGAVELGTRMLLVFVPQVLFYGVGIVLGGALQAGERFAWPALAPLLSSLVVIAAYLWYGQLAGVGRDAAGLPRTDELVLSLGTTVGVVVLALSQLPAARRLGISYRRTLRFPSGLAPAARAAALAGAFTLGAQELSTAVMLRLANQDTATGTVVALTQAQTVFLLPWAALAVPIAMSAFPRLATAWDRGEHTTARRLVTTSTRMVVALSAVGAAVLVAVAEPIGNVVLQRGSGAHAALAPAVVGFAFGLLGWGLVALFARCLYAARQVGVSAKAQVTGQALVIVADIVLAVTVPVQFRAIALAVGNSIGVTVAATLLLLAMRRHGLLDSVRSRVFDVLRAVGVAAVAGAVGWTVGRLAEGRGVASSIGLGLAAAVVAGAVALGGLIVVDRGLLALLRSRLRGSAT